MEKPTKILLYGTIIAAGVYGVWHIYDWSRSKDIAKLEGDIRTLTAQCEQSRRKPDYAPEEPILADSVPYICNAARLKNEPYLAYMVDGPSINTKLLDAQLALDKAKAEIRMMWPVILAVFIFITSPLPWLWYFFLRRIRELSDAIRNGTVK